MNRFTKEYKLKEIDFMDAKIGTVNRFKPMAFYLIGKAWINPIEEMEYKDKFEQCWDKLKQCLQKILSDNKVSKKHIASYDINFQSMSPNNSNYFYFDITMKQNEEMVSLKEIFDRMSNDVCGMMKEFRSDLLGNNFRINKNRQ